MFAKVGRIESPFGQIHWSLFLIFTAEEKKVKRYLEDNFKHRQDLVKPDDKLHNTNREYASEDERPIQHSGIGPRTKDGKDHSPIKRSSGLWKR